MTPAQNPIDFLAALAERLQTQDNLCTASPNYTIQEHHLITGIDEDFGPTMGWFDCEDGAAPASGRKAKALDRYRARYGKEPEGWTRTGYEYRWTPTGISFLTHDAAKAYLANQKHRHQHEIRIYVDSHYRNPEMREVRRLLSGPVLACITALREVTAELQQLHAHYYRDCEGGCPAHTYVDAAIDALDALTTHPEPHR